MGAKNSGEGHRSVSAWILGDVRLERYRHAPGPTDPIPKHTHEEYQFGLSLDAPGEYHYRGARHAVPTGALRVIQPGEAHASRDFGGHRAAETHLLYVPPRLLREVAAEVAGSDAGEPFFPSPVVLDPELTGRYRGLCAALGGQPAAALERDSLLLATLAWFVARHAKAPVASRRVGPERRAVGLVKAYLEDNLAENVSLARLGRLTNLSPHYLDRAFAREVGLPPHRYQVQARVRRAQALLGEGVPLGTVALATGFADQSHLGRHFKRLVGVSPGRYRVQAHVAKG